MATFKKGDQIFTPRDDSADAPSLKPLAKPDRVAAADTLKAPAKSASEASAFALPAPDKKIPSPVFAGLDANDEGTESPVFDAPQPPRPSPARDYQPHQKKKLIKPWGYVGYFLLFSIPLAGIICAIVFACSGDNKNRKNFARGWLLTLLVVILLSAAVGAGVYYLYLKPALDAGGTLTGILMQNTGSGLTSGQLSAVLRGDLSSLSAEQLQLLRSALAG